MKEMSVKEVEAAIIEGKKFDLIDVREVDELEAGKIPGVIHIPLGLMEFRMHELNKSKEYIMICRSGARSSRAARLLEEYGFNVTNMTGGMIAWEGTVE